MKMLKVGRLCVKIAGRDAGKKCVVVDIIDDNAVLIDGETRRRNCSIKHLEPLKETVKIKKKASHEDIAKALKKLDIEVRSTKPKKAAERPKKQRKKKEKQGSEEKPKKSSRKKTSKKTAKPTKKQVKK
ncbi:50S ribosomal protein L14e [Candidatus Woesearchaeota archaeon]|nr:50S ribosomal protein L14e [Candidatus Woesearchaeota archaeon]